MTDHAGAASTEDLLRRSSRPTASPRGQQLLALLLILLGVSVLIGWCLRLPTLTAVLPGLTSMVAITAGDFLLAGLALLAVGATPVQRHVGGIAAGLLLVLALLNLLQIAASIEVGINFPALHAWAADGNPKPGQQSLSASVSFVIGAVSLLMLVPIRPPQVLRLRLGRLLSALLFLIALSALVGYALRLELLFSWYALSKMALHTAIGLLMLSVALWWQWDRHDVAPGAEARDLRQMVSMALALVPALSAVLVVAIYREDGERALKTGLAVSRSSVAEGAATILKLRSTRAALVAAQLPALHLPPHFDASDTGAAAIRASLEGFLTFGFSYLALEGRQGRPMVTAGRPATPTGERLPLSGLPGGEVELETGQAGFLLRHRAAVTLAGGEHLTLVSEQPLAELTGVLDVRDPLGASARSALCLLSPAGAKRCAAASGQPLTLAEQAFVQLDPAYIDQIRRSPDGASVVAVQAVGGTGLLLFLGLDANELFTPVRHGLFSAAAVMLVVTALAVLLLRSRIEPLIRRLAQTEGRYHTVVESLSEGLLLLDPQGRVLAINGAACLILGIGRDDLLGRLVSALDWGARHADGRPMPVEEYPASQVLANDGLPVHLILSVERRDGQQRWLSVDASLTAGLVDDRSRCAVLAFTDITEQRQAEQLAASLEASYQMLVGGIADGVVSIDGLGIIHNYNAAAEQIFGHPAEAVLGRNVSMLMPERYRVHHDAYVRRYAEQKDPSIIGLRREVVGLRADGSEFPMMLALNVVPGSDSRFVALVTDIAERKRNERALVEAHGFRRALLDAAPYAVIASDTAFNCIEFNPAAERMLWYRAEEMLGRVVPPLIHDPQEVAVRAAELSEELGRRIEPGPDVFVIKAHQGIVEEREWTYIRKDGSRFPVNLAITEMYDDRGQPTGYLGIAYDITERKRREDYTRHVAHHDFLTGLPNRMLLNDRLGVAIETARRRQERLAVVMLDLDHFKRVNDSLGHHVGDLLLVEVGRRLERVLRSSDTVARLGGDEFVLLLPDIGDDLAGLERLADKVVQAVSAPVLLHGHELLVTPSIGIAVFPEDGGKADTLMKHADAALYRVKAQGRNGYRLFRQEMAAAADQRLDLEAGIRRALQRGEFELHYQPQVDLDSGAVVGMEALLRWNDAQRGAVSPAEFIPLAEETGLILPLGEWVLRTATRDAVDLRRRSGLPLRLAVNLSPRQFRQAELLSVVSEALAASGLPASELELEITEGALMVDTEETQSRLKALRAMGVSLAIDDFGVGFSSLSYITRFGIDTLKIDRAFIAALPDSASDAAVTQAVIALAHALDIRVVAEGVENDAQLAFLRARRCDLAQGARFAMAEPTVAFSVQGFHFSAALAPDEFVSALPALATGR